MAAPAEQGPFGTDGGFVLGPLVQKAAFAAYWTGIPWGWDLTDDKTLFAALFWGAAVFLQCGGQARRGGQWPSQAGTAPRESSSPRRESFETDSRNARTPSKVKRSPWQFP